jgi:hypothetical protein
MNDASKPTVDRWRQVAAWLVLLVGMIVSASLAVLCPPFDALSPVRRINGTWLSSVPLRLRERQASESSHGGAKAQRTKAAGTALSYPIGDTSGDMALV